MWIARNKYTGLRIFYNKPRRNGDKWVCGISGLNEGSCVDIETEEKFDMLTWNMQPVKVKIVVKKTIRL